MFFYNCKYDTMYHVTRKSAEEGLIKVLTSKVNSRFNAKISKKVIEDIMSNISIPNEYANDRCIYMSVDNESSELLGIRFSITASEVIKCKNPDTGDELVPIPLPKCKGKADYSELLSLDSISILSDLADYERKEGIIKQSGDFVDVTFRIERSYESLMAEYLENVFTRAYAIRIARAINKAISSEDHRCFLYRVNNMKPVIYEISHNGVCVLDTTSDASMLSTDSIMRVIKLYTRDITCVDEELTRIANLIHNMILYNIEYSKEELNNPYTFIKNPGNMHFCFQKKFEGIEFKFRTEPYNWISDFICAPFKDIEWTEAVSTHNCYYGPTYKGFRLVIPNTDMWLSNWPETDDDKIYIDGWSNKIVEDTQIRLKDNRVITEDTLVYFMVVLDN